MTATPELVSLAYQLDGESVAARIEVEWTPCHLGGRRAWFRCPTSGCNRRCAVLFLVEGRFGCRACHGLVYESQREDVTARMLRKAARLRLRLGIEDADEPARPPGMHRKTYRRLLAQAEAADRRGWTALNQSSRTTRRLPGP